MSYFVNVKSHDDLKSQYRRLARDNHPDAGGKHEVMQAINKEYDQLFLIWKYREKVTTNETAASTRREFYTQNGWQGDNYSIGLTLKEIICSVREFIKIHHNDCKFSVTAEYSSMSQALHITLIESPYRAYKTFDELTRDDSYLDREYTAVIGMYAQFNNLQTWRRDEIDNIVRPIYDKDFGVEAGIYFPKFLTPEVKEIVKAVEEYTNSFRYDDSDGQIDYFDTNFYFTGVDIWDESYKVVERKKKDGKVYIRWGEQQIS